VSRALYLLTLDLCSATQTNRASLLESVFIIHLIVGHPFDLGRPFVDHPFDLGRPFDLGHPFVDHPFDLGHPLICGVVLSRKDRLAQNHLSELSSLSK
jgi:hypothetical protein